LNGFGLRQKTSFEEKYRDPDWIIFDISSHGWAGTALEEAPGRLTQSSHRA
jgi:hypothetical protein